MRLINLREAHQLKLGTVVIPVLVRTLESVQGPMMTVAGTSLKEDGSVGTLFLEPLLPTAKIVTSATQSYPTLEVKEPSVFGTLPTEQNHQTRFFLVPSTDQLWDLSEALIDGKLKVSA